MDNQMDPQGVTPSWWQENHTSAWDTVKQAVGAKPIPPINAPNPPDAAGYDDVEPAARFGFGARTQFTTERDDTVETKLRDDWKATGSTRTFDDVKPHVRSGWDFANAKPVDKDSTH